MEDIMMSWELQTIKSIKEQVLAASIIRVMMEGVSIYKSRSISTRLHGVADSNPQSGLSVSGGYFNQDLQNTKQQCYSMDQAGR
jgi:hypothetical protein